MNETEIMCPCLERVRTPNIEINPGISLEGMMLKLKLQYFSCEELTHWKRLWCWERLGAGGEGDDPGWHGWTASQNRWTWVWVNSGRWWWTGRPGMLRFIWSQSRTWLSDWTELNWTHCLWPSFKIEEGSIQFTYTVFHALCLLMPLITDWLWDNEMRKCNSSDRKLDWKGMKMKDRQPKR